MTPLVQGGEVIEPLRDRVLGRVVSQDVYNYGGDELIAPAGTLLDEAWVDLLEQKGVDESLCAQ